MWAWAENSVKCYEEGGNRYKISKWSQIRDMSVGKQVLLLYGTFDSEDTVTSMLQISEYPAIYSSAFDSNSDMY